MNAINWFEIPAQDIDRAQRFYERLLGTSLRRETMGPQTLAVFPYEGDSAAGGCLISGPTAARTSAEGTLVYLAVTPTLDSALERLGAAGGQLATPKVTLPGDMGVFAHIVDSEGNRVGLHAMA
jgi:predicted enzyme related to lactoylglutathione lyase